LPSKPIHHVLKLSDYYSVLKNAYPWQLKGEFAVVPTDKIEGGAYHQKFPLIWTAYLWSCMSHDQRDLKVTYNVTSEIWIFEVIFVVFRLMKNINF
jgi:hypothetical protein